MSRQFLHFFTFLIVAILVSSSSVAATIQLAWDANSESDLVGYHVYRSTTSGSSYQRINSSPLGTPAFSDSTVQEGMTYYYVVTAVNTSGLESGYSNQVSATVEPTASGSANQIPSAFAGPIQVVLSRSSVTLSGSGSDPDGDPLTYSWSQISGPSVLLSNANQAEASFLAPRVSADTSLGFRLTVSDGKGGTASSDTLVVVKANQAPLVSTGAAQTTQPGKTVTLQATASDPEGDPMTYSWKQISGTLVSLSGSASTQATFTAPDKNGETLVFEFTASDGWLSSSEQTHVTISTGNQPPLLTMGPDQLAGQRQIVYLTATASDPDGDPLTFQWTQISGRNQKLNDADKLTAWFETPPGRNDLFVFKLTVNDGIHSVEGKTTVTTFKNLASALFYPITVDHGNSAFEDTFVGVALVNPNIFHNEVALESLDANGNLAEDVTREASLPALGQNAFLTHEIAAMDDLENVLMAEGRMGDIQGFFLIGDYGLTKLDGIGGKLYDLETFYFPMIRHSEKESTFFFLFNPDAEGTAEARVRLFDSKGKQLSEKQVWIPAAGSLTRTFDELFGNSLKVQEGFVEVASDLPLQGFELYALANEFSAVPAQANQSRSQLLAPHFFFDASGGTSELRLLNTGDFRARVKLEAFNDDSQLLGSSEFAIDPRQLFVGDIRDLLAVQATPSNPIVAGHLRLWLQQEQPFVVTNGAKVSGVVSFSGNQGKFHSTLPLIEEGLADSLYLQVAQSVEMNLFTGFAILNPGSVTTQVTIRAYTEGGQLAAQRTVSLAPGQRVVDLLNGPRFFGESFQQIKGHVRITSAQPVVTFALFGDYDSNYLAAIEGQPPVSDLP